MVQSSCASMPLRLPESRRSTDKLVGISGVDLTTRHTDCCKCSCEFVARVQVLVHRGSDKRSRADRVVVTVTVVTECTSALWFCSSASQHTSHWCTQLCIISLQAHHYLSSVIAVQLHPFHTTARSASTPLAPEH